MAARPDAAGPGTEGAAQAAPLSPSGGAAAAGSVPPRGASGILPADRLPAPPSPPDRPGPLHVRSLTLLRGRIRRILTLAGMPPVWGRPGPGDLVGVWGQTPTARRGERLAARRGARLVRIEDAWLRSIRPARSGGEPPLGLLIDRTGVHFDPSRPSDLETLLSRHPLDDTGLLARAHLGMARLAALDLSKYNAHDPAAPPPEAGYVLVIDQVRDDASVRASAAGRATFAAMLDEARAAHPGARIVIRSHPETAAGVRRGHYGPEDCDDRTSLHSAPVSPRRMLEGAVAVYTLSSQLGFEAILAGHRPVVFGGPFYAGWGLTDDRMPLPRRGRRLSRAQLFAAAMLLYPVWHDPCRDRPCTFEDAVDHLEAAVRVWREDRAGHVALGMRLWKRGAMQAGFGRYRPLVFAASPARAVARARATGRGLLVWASQEPEGLDTAGLPVLRVEDGFLRSRGLGAALTPALSLVTDDRGIYFDPTRASRLERLIAAPPPPGAEDRARRLIARLVATGLSKYNLTGDPLPPLPEGRRILVPGQVEDDASIRLGAGTVRTNLDLLRAARAANPDAVILFKPHPDVEAGLRPGAVTPEALAGLADAVLRNADPAALLAQVDAVWTITSGLGFEALLRGVPVTCLGAPFYAGWGLTDDRGPVPARRQARPTLAALVHAALVAYPRYSDPVSGLPCPVEVAVERLAADSVPRAPVLRLLAKVQGLLAGQAWIWRR